MCICLYAHARLRCINANKHFAINSISITLLFLQIFTYVCTYDYEFYAFVCMYVYVHWFVISNICQPLLEAKGLYSRLFYTAWKLGVFQKIVIFTCVSTTRPQKSSWKFLCTTIYIYLNEFRFLITTFFFFIIILLFKAFWKFMLL